MMVSRSGKLIPRAIQYCVLYFLTHVLFPNRGGLLLSSLFLPPSNADGVVDDVDVDSRVPQPSAADHDPSTTTPRTSDEETDSPFSLFVFDATAGALKTSFPPQMQRNLGLKKPITSLPHTAVLVHGRLYSLEDGPSIKKLVDEDPPKDSRTQTSLSQLRGDPRFQKEITGGLTRKSQREIESFLEQKLNPGFDGTGPAEYHLLENNCNHYVDRLVRFIGVKKKGIPERFLDHGKRLREAGLMDHPLVLGLIEQLGGQGANPFVGGRGGKKTGQRAGDKNRAGGERGKQQEEL